MINNGNFKGYDRVLDKKGELAQVRVGQLYKEKRYSDIVKYIKQENEVFIKAYQTLKKEMPSLAKHL